jgi:RNA polymerase sigma-70 factor (ECF subfamily)
MSSFGDPVAGERELAARVAAGDLEALGEFYDALGAVAYSVAVRILGDPGLAEDVVQECFLKVCRRTAQFDPARGSLRSWLLQSVRNRAIDHLRGRLGHERQEEELHHDLPASGVGSDPWREVALALERDAIREAMATLPDEQRQAVELAYFGGYTYRDVAEMTRVPLATTKGRMRLALEKLHSYLAGRGLNYGD